MAEITAAMVKELRDKTGAGMMDCKKALQEAEGDFEKAVELLRKKGIAKAAKRAEREANEGVVTAYIHPGSKLGVLVEVNCETDFVAKTDDFQAFAKNIAMHIAASNPLAISREELDQETLEKEKQLYREQALESGKPENIVDRIVEGRMEKYFSEVCLLEQPYVKDPDKTVKDLLTETIAKVGENINIKRFARFRIGE
ncbi:translation elongation factor Ts [Caldithrix abyssi]|uniref:Elongation factor Ts n=1 Tax=Caldithrix abyssi DSM 13497 TaxID=880073 RepID=H1XXB6_CALAY|nr:translation elongation factor Ts [Caldithrix abyssi]APF17834.1 tsf translation elongation factor Ts (EF-Ts) [Caldithrix abyssi DSM 13497]EHO41901.1 Elongation factor Ts [Caldithrix abyssi DSM 13497]